MANVWRPGFISMVLTWLVVCIVPVMFVVVISVCVFYVLQTKLGVTGILNM